MAKAAQNSSDLNINLLQKEEVGGTTGDLIHWVLTIGRYLIIATEIIALVTFGLGIKYSADKNDLKSKVSAAKIEVDTKATCEGKNEDEFCEKRFRELQDRINQIKAQQSSQFQQSQVLKEFLALLPIGVSLNNLSIEGNQVSFGGFFPTSVNLQTLIISFSSSNKIVDLDIQELTSPSTSEPNFTFKATATLQPSEFKKRNVDESEVN